MAPQTITQKNEVTATQCMLASQQPEHDSQILAQQGEDQIHERALEIIRQQRSRQFSVLTCCQHAPRVKLAVALLDGLF